MSEAPRRRWPYLLIIALLLVIIAFLLYGKLSPAPRPDGKGAPFAPEHRVAILAALEGGWGAFIVAARRALMDRAGVLGKVLRLVRIAVTVAGIAVGVASGALAWSFLSADVHGTPSGSHHHHWDWD